MRKTLAVAVGLTVLFAASAMAGDYHYRTTLNCPDCHVMHSSNHTDTTQTARDRILCYAGGSKRALLRNEVIPLASAVTNNQTFARTCSRPMVNAVHQRRQAAV